MSHKFIWLTLYNIPLDIWLTICYNDNVERDTAKTHGGEKMKLSKIEQFESSVIS